MSKIAILILAGLLLVVAGTVVYVIVVSEPFPGEINNELEEARVPGAYDNCRIAGCSGEVCANEEVITLCIWKPEFSCYQDKGIYERGQNGECTWRQTSELTQCIAAAKL